MAMIRSVELFQQKMPSKWLRQQDDGGFRVDGLDALREVEHIDFAHVVHRDDQVVLRPFLHHLQRFHGGFRPLEDRRVGEVQFGIFGGDPGLDASVLFEGELVVVVAHEQDPADPPGHQGRSRFSHLSSVLIRQRYEKDSFVALRAPRKTTHSTGRGMRM